MQKPTLIALIIFLLVVLAGGFWYYTLEERKSVLYETAVSDPLFYSPDINIADLQKAIERLEQSERAFLTSVTARIEEGSLMNNPEDIKVLKKIIKKGIFPIGYLKQLPKTIESTDRFLESQTAGNAFSMLWADYITAKKYRRAAKHLEPLLQESIEAVGGNSFTFEFLASTITNKTLANDFSLIKQNGDMLVTESRARLVCFLFTVCNIPDRLNDLSIFFAPETTEGFAPRKFGTLSDEMLSGRWNLAVRTGPYVLRSGCFPDEYTPLYLYKDLSQGFVLKQANDNYYYKLDVLAEESGSNYGEHFIEQGIVVDDQPEGADYRCADLRYWGDAAAIDYARLSLGFTDVNSSDDLAALYNTLKNAEADFEQQKQLRVLENKIVGLPLMLSQIAANVDFYHSILQFSDYVAPKYLLGARTAYSLTYNTFSRSVWRLPKLPTYLDKQNTDLTHTYTTYSELHKTLPDEEIKAFHINPADYIE